MVEVVEAGGAMQLVQVPLQAGDISALLETEPHRVTMYIADPQLQPLVGDPKAQFRDLKVCNLPLPISLVHCDCTKGGWLSSRILNLHILPDNPAKHHADGRPPVPPAGQRQPAPGRDLRGRVPRAQDEQGERAG